MAVKNECARCKGSLDSGYYPTVSGNVCVKCATELGWASEQQVQYLNGTGPSNMSNNSFGGTGNPFEQSGADMQSSGNPFESAQQNNGNPFGGSGMSAGNNSFSEDTGNPFAQQATGQSQQMANSSPFGGMTASNPFEQQSAQVGVMMPGNGQVDAANPFAQQTSGSVVSSTMGNMGNTFENAQVQNGTSTQKPKVKKVKEPKQGGKGLPIVPIICGVIGLVIIIIVIVGIKSVIDSINAEDAEGGTSDTAVATSVNNEESKITVSEDIQLVTGEQETEVTEETSVADIKEAVFDANTINLDIGLKLAQTPVGSNGAYTIELNNSYGAIKKAYISFEAEDIFGNEIPDLTGSSFLIDLDEIEDNQAYFEITSIYSDEPVFSATVNVYYIEFEDGQTIGTEDYEDGVFIASYQI